MKKLILPLVAFAMLSTYSTTEVRAQATGTDYKNAIGGRFGIANGVTFKHFLTNDQAIDVILNFRSRRDNYSRFKLVGLYQWHLPIDGAPGLRWYYGVGGGVGVWTDKRGNRNDSEVDLSIDGVIGLDYKISGAPINLALDWKPALNLSPDTGLDAEGIGLSVRFAF